MDSGGCSGRNLSRRSVRRRPGSSAAPERFPVPGPPDPGGVRDACGESGGHSCRGGAVQAGRLSARGRFGPSSGWGPSRWACRQAGPAGRVRIGTCSAAGCPGRAASRGRQTKGQRRCSASSVGRGRGADVASYFKRFGLGVRGPGNGSSPEKGRVPALRSSIAAFCPSGPPGEISRNVRAQGEGRCWMDLTLRKGHRKIRAFP